MTRTKKTRMRAAAVAGALGVGALVFAAVPAYAKGDVSVSAPRTAHVGKTFKVTAHGDDDAAPYLKICVQDRTGRHPWRQVSCGKPVARGYGESKATAFVRAGGRGAIQFRAVAYEMSGPRDRHPVWWRASEVVTVRVR